MEAVQSLMSSFLLLSNLCRNPGSSKWFKDFLTQLYTDEMIKNNTYI